MPAKARDPRVDPKVGDAVRSAADFEYVIYGIDEDGDIWADRSDGEVAMFDPVQWRTWAATAEVIRTAEVVSHD